MVKCVGGRADRDPGILTLVLPFKYLVESGLTTQLQVICPPQKDKKHPSKAYTTPSMNELCGLSECKFFIVPLQQFATVSLNCQVHIAPPKTLRNWTVNALLFHHHSTACVKYMNTDESFTPISIKSVLHM